LLIHHPHHIKVSALTLMEASQLFNLALLLTEEQRSLEAVGTLLGDLFIHHPHHIKVSGGQPTLQPFTPPYRGTEVSGGCTLLGDLARSPSSSHQGK
jgi:hypothetical protein